MPFKPVNFRPALLLTAILIASAPFGGRVAKAQNTWSDPVKVTRKVKPRKQYKVKVRSKQTVRVRLLSVQFRVLTVKQDGTTTEINPQAVFNPGDHLRLAVKANQRGFLYIIHQPALDQPGVLLFPNSRINNGLNEVEREVEFIVPSGCPTEPCVYEVNSARGQEVFTVIFSRDQFLDLPNSATDVSGGISPQFLQQMANFSGQQLSRPQTGDSVFSIRISNLNRSDNEEIVVPYMLRKSGLKPAGTSIR